MHPLMINIFTMRSKVYEEITFAQITHQCTHILLLYSTRTVTRWHFQLYMPIAHFSQTGIGQAI